MTQEEYKQISEALNDLKDKIINSIDRHTEETIKIIQDNG